MSIVQMNCPNCGGETEWKNGQYVCPYCHTILLNIVDAKIDCDVTILSSEEFSKKLDASRRQFVVKFDDKLEVFDVETKVINKRIQDATALLAERRFGDVLTMLEPIRADLFAVERLRYLAHCHVTSEYELAFFNDYIPEYNYKKLLSLCDAETRKTYEAIRNIYYENNDARREISRVEELLKVDLRSDAILYAGEMCRKYPYTALSWAYLIWAKNDGNFSTTVSEFEKMKECDDYRYIKLPAATSDIVSKEYHRRKESMEAHYREIQQQEYKKESRRPHVDHFGGLWIYDEDSREGSFCAAVTYGWYWQVGVLCTVIGLLFGIILSIRGVETDLDFYGCQLINVLIKCLLIGAGVGFVARPLLFAMMSATVICTLYFLPFYWLFLLIRPIVRSVRAANPARRKPTAQEQKESELEKLNLYFFGTPNL